jgi:hypothetical protein
MLLSLTVEKPNQVGQGPHSKVYWPLSVFNWLSNGRLVSLQLNIRALSKVDSI